jgi:hypothetical protein
MSAESETLTAQTDPLGAPPCDEVLDLRTSREIVDPPAPGESGTTIDLRGLVLDSGLRAVIDELHVRLLAQYGDQVGAAHVARVVEDSVARFSSARFTTYVPVLVEKAAKDQLRAAVRRPLASA